MQTLTAWRTSLRARSLELGWRPKPARVGRHFFGILQLLREERTWHHIAEWLANDGPSGTYLSQFSGCRRFAQSLVFRFSQPRSCPTRPLVRSRDLSGVGNLPLGKSGPTITSVHRPPLPLGTEKGGTRAARFPKADDQPRFAVGLLHCSIFSTRHDVVPVA